MDLGRYPLAVPSRRTGGAAMRITAGQNLPPPSLDPLREQAVRANQEQDYRNDLGVTQDLRHVGGLLVLAIRWPIRQVLRFARR